MSGLRYADVSQKERKFLDLTSLTVEAFDQLVPSFEEAFQERMQQWREHRQEAHRKNIYAICQQSASHTRGSSAFYLGLLEDKSPASHAGRGIWSATEQSESMDTHLIACSATDATKAWGCASSLDGRESCAVEAPHGGSLACGTGAAPHNGGLVRRTGGGSFDGN